MLLFRSAGIGQNIQEVLAALFGSETTGNLGLDFDHAKITLRLVIVKRNGKIRNCSAPPKNRDFGRLHE